MTAVVDEECALVSQGKNLNQLYGASPSDIDKYSRVIFPVCFACFHLMYWVIYLHISDVVAENLTLAREVLSSNPGISRLHLLCLKIIY